MSFYSLDTDLFNQQFLPPRKRNNYLKAWGKVLLTPIQWLIDVFFGGYAYGNSDEKVTSFSMDVTYGAGQMVYYSDNMIYECILSSTGNLPTDITYFSVKTFASGDRIRYINKAVYEVIDTATAILYPAGTQLISGYYCIKVQDNFIGIIERTKTNSQILLFESILNKWFDTSFNYPSSTNDIYIVHDPGSNNSFLFGVDEDESSAIAATDAEQSAFIDTSLVTSTTNFAIYFPLIDYDVLKPSDASGSTTTKDNIVRAFADKYVCAGITYTIIPY